MSVQKRVVKNVSSNAVTIGDITTYGVEVQPSTKVDLLKKAKLTAIAKSTDIVLAINAGLLVVFDENNNRILNKTSAIRYIQQGPAVTTSAVTAAGALLNPMTADLDADSFDIFDAETISFEAEYDNGNSGAAATIDWNNGQKQKITLTDNSASITFADPRGVCNLMLRVVQDGVGSRGVTWVTGVRWPAGTAPTFTSTVSAIDIAAFYFDGTNYYGISNFDFKVP